MVMQFLCEAFWNQWILNGSNSWSTVHSVQWLCKNLRHKTFQFMVQTNSREECNQHQYEYQYKSSICIKSRSLIKLNPPHWYKCSCNARNFESWKASPGPAYACKFYNMSWLGVRVQKLLLDLKTQNMLLCAGSPISMGLRTCLLLLHLRSTPTWSAGDQTQHTLQIKRPFLATIK